MKTKLMKINNFLFYFIAISTFGTTVLLTIYILLSKAFTFSGFFKFILFYIFFYFIVLFKKKSSLKLNNIFYYILFIFLFNSLILGEFFDFYYKFPLWDVFLHTISGFLITYLSLKFLQLKIPSIKEQKLIWYTYSISFAMLLASFWEMYEFFVDNVFGANMQKGIIFDNVTSKFSSQEIITYLNSHSWDQYPERFKELSENIINTIAPYIQPTGRFISPDLIDTMEDFIVCLFGSLVMILIYDMYLKHKNKKD